MTDAQIQVLVAEYKRLQLLLEQEQSKALMEMSNVRYYEDKMARIETQFQRSDVDICQWL